MNYKNIFIKSTLILILGGVITKILAFIVKLIYIRMVGEYVVSLYSLVTPTYSLIISIATFSLPTTISKLVSENEYKRSNIISTAIILITIINFIITFILLILSKYISINLLHEKDTYYLLISMALTFPIISISSIIKGYYYGKQNMIPNALSNIIEEIVRGFLIILLVPKLLIINKILAACSLFFITFIEEIISIIVNLLFLNKKINYFKLNYKPSVIILNKILTTSMPILSSRIISNISYFFEPIILKKILLDIGYNNKYILLEYSAYNVYSLNILTLPSFFIIAISSSMIPEISKYFKRKNYKYVIKRFNECIKFSLIIGISYSIILLLFGDKILYLLYNTKSGLNYIYVLSFIFPLYYLESIFTSFMQVINKSKITFKITIIGLIIKNISLILISYLKIGLYSLVISEIINIITIVFLNIIYIKREIKKFAI